MVRLIPCTVIQSSVFPGIIETVLLQSNVSKIQHIQALADIQQE
jgi:hypothetical protein